MATSIQEDTNASIWIKASEHLCKFNGQTFIPVFIDQTSALLTSRSDEEWKTELDYLRE